MPKKKTEYDYVRKTFTFDGRRYEVVGATEEEAILKKAAKLRELEAGQLTSSSTVRQWSQIWLETYVKPRGMTAKSYRMYTDILDNVILPAIGGMKLRQVSDIQLQKIVNSRQELSSSTVIKTRMVLRAMFKRAVNSRLIAFDPAADLTLPKAKKGGHRSLTAVERAALLKVADYPTFSGYANRSGLWLRVLLYAGLRPGETAALRWEDIDLDAGNIHVRQAKEAGSMTIKDPKTEAGIRTIPINDELLPYLMAEAKPSGFVFTQKDGSPLSEESIKARWRTVKKYMDIELGAKVERIKPKGRRKSALVITQHAIADDLDLYCLRHTFCTDLEKKLVPLNVAKVLMGHSDVTMTANIYSHADEETLELARSLINAKPAR